MSGADGADETILAGGDPLGQQESDCSDEDQKQAVHLYVIYPDAQERRVEPLNTAARNQLVRNNPDLISFSITQCLRQLANQHGFYRKEGCIVSWDTSIIPFHLEYTVKWSNAECQHLVSVRSHSLQNVVSNHSAECGIFSPHLGAVCKRSYPPCQIISVQAFSKTESSTSTQPSSDSS